MNLLYSLRYRPPQKLVIGSLLALILMCVWPQMFIWPLLPESRSDLVGSWVSDPSSIDAINLIITGQDVSIQEIRCCRPSRVSYPIGITDGVIAYPGLRQRQYYWIGKSIDSLFRDDEVQPQLIILTPGPIPMGIYTYGGFGPIHWDPSP